MPFRPSSVLSAECCHELGLTHREQISTEGLRDAIDQTRKRAERLERNLRTGMRDGVVRLSRSQRTNFQTRLDAVEAAIAEAEQLIPGPHQSWFGNPWDGEAFGRLANDVAAENAGLIQCRAESCEEILDVDAAFSHASLCTRHFTIATGSPDPEPWKGTT